MIGKLKSRQHFVASLCIKLILDLENASLQKNRHFKAKQDMAVYGFSSTILNQSSAYHWKQRI